MTAPANAHSGSWDVVAADGEARARLWRELSAAPAREVVLPAMPERPESVGPAVEALHSAGFRLLREPGPRSPFLPLPDSFAGLLQTRSRNLRSQLGRRRRALDREGKLTFRTATNGEALERDLEAVFRVEAAGWKAGAGTAILCNPRTERLYRDFARRASAHGWLRLHLLELDGVAIAADYAVAFAGGEFLLKTGFDERYARWSPGLVLRAEALRSAIDERLAFYDFLGDAHAYKLRWTDEVRPRITLRAYRGPTALPAFAYRRAVRPLLKSLRARARAADPRLDQGSRQAGSREA